MEKDKSDKTKWAREVIKAYFEKREPIELKNAQDLDVKSACFVTLHNPDNSLRGCIGTIIPVRDSLKTEIKYNAISAAFQDPRFEPLLENELDGLIISVDVLGEPEPVISTDELNPKIYGVIVSSGEKRGVLLPDLGGVDTVDKQLMIAMQKAGIQTGSKIYVERFKVDRFY